MKKLKIILAALALSSLYSLGAFALTQAETGVTLAQQPLPLPRAREMQPTLVPKHAAVTHGTWMQGTPGTYTVTVCEAGCTINGAPGTTINMVFEAWGAGGGGGGGSSWTDAGGGGGAYAKAGRQVIVPQNGTLTYHVTVGSGGTPDSWTQGQGQGGDGGASEVGDLKAWGGKGGRGGSSSGGQGGAGGGTLLGQGGQSGGQGPHPNTCNGGAGGAGGIGAGPGAINNGGNGGHGSYQHSVVFPTCTAHGQGYGRTAGAAGGNGRVRIVW